MHEVKGSDNRVTAVGAVSTFYMRAMSLEPHPMVRASYLSVQKGSHVLHASRFLHHAFEDAPNLGNPVP